MGFYYSVSAEKNRIEMKNDAFYGNQQKYCISINAQFGSSERKSFREFG